MNYLTIGQIKAKAMKSTIIKLFLSLVCAFYVVSCVTEALEIDRQYQIANMTEFDVRIKFYDSFSGNTYKVELKTNEVYNGDLLNYRSGNVQLDDGDSFFPSSAYKSSDSLTIFFDESKYALKYFTLSSPTKAIFSDPLERNPFRHGSYKKLKNEVFLFEITNNK